LKWGWLNLIPAWLDFFADKVVAFGKISEKITTGAVRDRERINRPAEINAPPRKASRGISRCKIDFSLKAARADIDLTYDRCVSEE
jgi:hypothetical protein